MNTRGLYQLAETLTNEHISMCFSGYISQKVLIGLAASLRSQIVPFGIDKSKAQRVFSVFIEQVQNIMRYSTAKLDDDCAIESGRFGLVTFGFADGSFFVIAGNEMLSSEAQKLRRNLEEIRRLNKRQLLARFRKRMTLLANDDRDLADLRGPGLGLLEIARHVSQPVEFDLIELKSNLSYFIMKAYI